MWWTPVRRDGWMGGLMFTILTTFHLPRVDDHGTDTAGRRVSKFSGDITKRSNAHKTSIVLSQK